MSNKDLQRVTKSVSYIGQAISRRSLFARRNHITQKGKVPTTQLYLSVRDDEQPAENLPAPQGKRLLLRLIGLYDVIARLMSLSLQYGAPLEKVGDLLTGLKFEPCGGHLETEYWRQRT